MLAERLRRCYGGAVPSNVPPAQPFQTTRKTPWITIGIATIVLATLLAYIPAIGGGFIWDDDSYVTANPLLQDLDGLRRIWVPRQTPQYYPAVFSMFWVEYQLWGLNPFGYHLINVLLHTANALLVWRLCQRIGILRGAGAWLIAAIFALHPVHVESVAWITERKNVLSGLFYLLSMLAYLRFEDERPTLASRPWRWWALSLMLFILALLSKTVTCSLPAALILIMLYRRTPITPRRLTPLLPFFCIGLALALQTANIERMHVGASGEEFAFTVADRLLIASRALLFYPWKVIWPWPVMFIYPRWSVNASSIVSYWPLAIVAALAAMLMIAYHRGRRGPALAVAFYAGTILPALGFIDIYPMVFSFVADHFQYLASLGVNILLGVAVAQFPNKWLRISTGAAILSTLFVLTWLQASTYQNAESVYRDTLSKNNDAWMPHNNLGNILLERDPVAAEHEYREALRIKPDHYTAQSNLAEALRRQNRIEEAMVECRKAIYIIQTEMQNQGVAVAPRFLATDYYLLGRLHEARGRLDDAEIAYRQADAIAPGLTNAHLSLAQLLMRQHRSDDAATVVQSALDREPDNWVLLRAMAVVRQSQSMCADAISLYEQSLARTQSLEDWLQVAPPLIRLLTSCDGSQQRNVNRAIALGERMCELTNWSEPASLDILASAYAQAGQTEQAMTTAQRALELARQSGMAELAQLIQNHLNEWQQRK